MELNIGVHYIMKKQYAEAEKSLNQALENENDSGKAYYYLGLCYYCNENCSKENNEAACNYFSEAIKRNTQIEDSNLKMGLIYFKEKQYAVAEEYFRKAQCANENNWYPCYLQGQIFFKRKQFDLASREFNKAMQLCQDKELIECLKGNIYSMIKLNKKEEAFIFFNEHLSKFKDKPEVLQLEARIHKELGDCSQALSLIDKALEMKPMNNLIMIGDRVTYNYHCRNYYECIKEGEELLNLFDTIKTNKHWSIYFYIGSSYLKLKNTDKGAKYIEKYEGLIKDFPDDILIEYFIEKAALVFDTTDISKSKTECLKYIDMALERNGEYLPALLMKNELKLLSDKPEETDYLEQLESLMIKKNEGVKLPQVIPDVELVINSLQEVNHY